MGKGLIEKKQLIISKAFEKVYKSNKIINFVDKCK